jgi:hypothetical protein
MSWTEDECFNIPSNYERINMLTREICDESDDSHDKN